MTKIQVSPETVDEALKVAKATARPGQTKEQTKLIAKGIEKGIAEYKKREKAKARERDKERKKTLRTAETRVTDQTEAEYPPPRNLAWLPWALLAASWLGFIAFTLLM